MFNPLAYPEAFRSALIECWRKACHGNIEAALAQAAVVRQAAEDDDNTFAGAFALHQMAWFCFQLGKVEQGLDHVRSACQIWKALSLPFGMASSGALHGWLLLEAGLTDEAAVEALQAFEIAETVQDPIVLAFASTALGVVYWYNQQFDRAVDLCGRAVTALQPVGEPVALGWWLINLAGAHSDIGYAAEKRGDTPGRDRALCIALAINQDAIDLSTRYGDTWGLRLGLCNAAEYLAACGREAEALAHLDRCEAIEIVEGSERSATQFLYTRAQVLIRFGRFAEALPICTAALAAAEQHGHTYFMSYALRYLSNIHEGLGQFDEALASFKRFHDVQAGLTAENIQRRTRIAEIRYESKRLRSVAAAAEQRAALMARTSRLDPLTDLANRRAFEEMQATLDDRQRSYAIAIIDLDHFKSINDRFSHLTGDNVLKRVASVLLDMCRLDDLAVRLGGEEFVLVIDGVDLDAAHRLCLSLQRRLATVDWRELHPHLQVTASIGVATNLDAPDPKSVLAVADARLYQAKETGRNKVVAFTDRARFAAKTSATGAGPERTAGLN